MHVRPACGSKSSACSSRPSRCLRSAAACTASRRFYSTSALPLCRRIAIGYSGGVVTWPVQSPPAAYSCILAVPRTERTCIVVSSSGRSTWAAAFRQQVVAPLHAPWTSPSPALFSHPTSAPLPPTPLPSSAPAPPRKMLSIFPAASTSAVPSSPSCSPPWVALAPHPLGSGSTGDGLFAASYAAELLDGGTGSRTAHRVPWQTLWRSRARRGCPACIASAGQEWYDRFA
eukprot:5629005-Prymnesium_polylepis.2